jgi:crotonobetainyl-CoA:carnitine CoA-transferase CaiB-like acyl-CoA transferase
MRCPIALLHRFRTGEGQEVKLSMFETMAAFNLSEHQWGHVFDPPVAPMGYPSVRAGSRRPCATKDGYLAFLPYSDTHWHAFFRLVGKPELIASPAFGTSRPPEALEGSVRLPRHRVRQAHHGRMAGAAGGPGHPDVRGSTTSRRWRPIRTCRPSASGRRWSIPPKGRLKFPAHPLGLDRSPPTNRRMAPHLGEHTESVLAEHGFRDDEIAQLLARGVAVQHAATQPVAEPA